MVRSNPRPRCRPVALVLAVACLLDVPLLHAATVDYAREARWKAEVVPAVVVGEAIDLPVPGRAPVLAILTEPAATAKGAIVLVHGLGVHPDFGIIGALRTRLHDAGYATLSVQMPVLAAGAERDDYVVAFPEAGERIAAALEYVRARGMAPVAIVAHSLGASMVEAYLARADARPIEARVALGMPVPFARPPREPVLDVVAEQELPAVVAAAKQRAAAPSRRCSTHETISGADHYLEREAQAVAELIARFLANVSSAAC